VPVNLFYSITVRVFEKISTWPLPVAWRYIALLQRELQVQFSENDILGLTLYLGITLQRVNKNRTAVIAEDLTQAVQCLDEFPVISNLMRRLKQERGTLLSPEEQALFTIEVRERICRP
jgi:transcriptional regulatory protein LevR